MSKRVLVCGTFVPDVLSAIVYRGFRADAVLPIPELGMGHINVAYEFLECELLEQSAEEPIDLIGNSQGALLAALFALCHPRRVRRLILLSGPFDGTTRARLLEVSAARCMRPSSRLLRALRARLDAFEWPAGLEVSCVSSGHDWLVSPGLSAFIDHPRIHNYCLSARRPHWIDGHDYIAWHQVDDIVLPVGLERLLPWPLSQALGFVEDAMRNHLGEVVLPATAKFVDQLLTSGDGGQPQGVTAVSLAA